MELYVWGAIVLVLLLVIAWAYRSCRLNSFLPKSWKRDTKDCKTSSFVGTYASNAAMGSCHHWDNNGKKSSFNRCTYM